MAYKEMYFVSDSYGNLTVHPEVLSITQNSNNTKIKLCGNFTDEALVWATIIQADGKTLSRRAVMLTAETIEIESVDYRVYSYRLVQDDTKICPSATGVLKISFSIEESGEEILTTNEYSLTIMRSNISAVTNTPADTIDAVATKVNQNTADIAELESGMASIDLEFDKKVDKINEPEGMEYAYTHSGAEQGQREVSETSHGAIILRAISGGICVRDESRDDYATSIGTTEWMIGNAIDDNVTSKRGQPNGIATLDGGGKIPSWQLPSYVDDVIEVATFSALPATGENGKIYVTLDTNLTYRWSGTQYVEISKSLALGETSTTAYRGDKGKELYDFTSPAFESGKNLQDKLNTKADKTELIQPWETGAVTANAFTADATANLNYILTNSQDVALTIENAYNGASFSIQLYGGHSLTLPANCRKPEDWLSIYGNEFYEYDFRYNGTIWTVTRSVMPND